MTFALVPNEVIRDHSLTLIETRVLIALYSYRDPKSTAPVWPGRAALSKRCGYHPDVISRATTGLEKKGWIRKVQRGKKQSNVYEILGKSDPTEPVRSVESDLTEPVRGDLTDPVRSIGTNQLTNQFNNIRGAKNVTRKLSAVERAEAATKRLASRISAERKTGTNHGASLAKDE